MARIPLRLTDWEYDDEANVVVATFVESAPTDAASPASFQPGQFFTIEIHSTNTLVVYDPPQVLEPDPPIPTSPSEPVEETVPNGIQEVPAP